VRAVIYALVWKANEIGPHVNDAFQERIPRLMGWLKELKKNGNLVAKLSSNEMIFKGYARPLTWYFVQVQSGPKLNDPLSFKKN
jgi:hypothetical protein